MISGIKEAYIVTATETITLSYILPKSGAVKFPVYTTDGDGQIVHTKDKSEVIIYAADVEQYFALRDIMTNKTDITKIKLRGIEHHFFFKEATTITVKRGYMPRRGGNNFIVIKARYLGDPTSNIYFSSTWEAS